MSKQEINNKLAEMGLTIESKFVPFSQSRNKNENMKSLNWIVTLKKNNKIVLTTDYMMGCGHCPSYNQMDNTQFTRNLINYECENGYSGMYIHAGEKAGLREGIYQKGKNPILPDSADVINSLLLDSEVFGMDFADWCSEFGYDEDSRKAEKIFNDCMKIANKFVAAVGTNGIEQLREIFQDY